jgi:hypothetical protein
MAASPRYKVYANGKYQAACHEIEAAAALAAFYGKGAEIRAEHSSGWTLWTEGAEKQPAGESYDYVAQVCTKRLQYRQVQAYKQNTGRWPQGWENGEYQGA